MKACRFAAVDPEHVCVDAFGAPLKADSEADCNFEARMQIAEQAYALGEAADVVTAALEAEVKA